MFILLFIIMVLVVYIAAFKDDFSKEHLDKLMPVLFILIALFILILLLSFVRS